MFHLQAHCALGSEQFLFYLSTDAALASIYMHWNFMNEYENSLHIENFFQKHFRKSYKKALYVNI